MMNGPERERVLEELAAEWKRFVAALDGTLEHDRALATSRRWRNVLRIRSKVGELIAAIAPDRRAE